MRRRAPRPIGAALASLTGELRPATPLARVHGVWREAVGDAVAAQAEPVAERDGVLTVSCRSAVWAQELDLMSPALLEALNGRLGGARLTRMRCVAAPPRNRR